MSSTTSSADFKVGDKVWVPMPLNRVCGTVTEDRGHLGRGGRRLYYVSVPNHPYNTHELLVSADEIDHLTAEEQAVLYEPLASEEIKQFLINGGLMSILVHNSAEPVWLRRGPRGNVTHTFIEGYSTTGGAIPPPSALHEEKISASQRNAVIRFVKTFGLNDSDAENVVNQFGVSQ